MAHIFEDRIFELSTSTGTGDIALAGAVTAYRAFSSVLAIGDTLPYMVEAVDSNGKPTGDYEYGLGTYSAANTITRTQIRGSSNAGAAVNFTAGTKFVQLAVCAPASAAAKAEWRAIIGAGAGIGANNDITSMTALVPGGLPNASVLPADLAQPLTIATAQATTSGTSKDFTGIPSWVTRITVMIFGVSTNGINSPAVQIGTGGAPTTTGYKNEVLFSGTATASNSNFLVGVPGGGAGNTLHGSLVLLRITGNTWVASGTIACLDGNTGVAVTGGSLALAGALDMVRFLATGGDTFDAGSVNIMYE